VTGDLAAFRDHARLMANGGPAPPRRATGWCAGVLLRDCSRCLDDGRGCACSCHDVTRPCPPTDEQRQLWAQLADEADARLVDGETDQPLALHDTSTTHSQHDPEEASRP
jgi:hypothetical protein